MADISNTWLIYPLSLQKCVATYHTCELSIHQHRQCCVSKYFHHSQEDFAYLVLCVQDLSPNLQYPLNRCRLNSQIHCFQQHVGHFWKKYEDWQNWLLLWHPQYQCKSYQQFSAMSAWRTLKIHLQKLLELNFVSVCKWYVKSTFVIVMMIKADAVIFVHFVNLLFPLFQAQAHMTLKISFSCLKLSLPSVQEKWNLSLTILTIIILNQFVIICTNTTVSSFIFSLKFESCQCFY